MQCVNSRYYERKKESGRKPFAVAVWLTRSAQ
uniref:Uncharacterized protein n=1 Tax=Coprothermobacter proteolyticus (strain ATCC 35245 / DSM 5265 / OCM 4 / BT) TaxID=309798 RepID=B5Y6B1_COPPD